MKKLITFLFGILVSVTACSQEKNMVTENRNVGAYTQIEVSGAYVIVLTEGTIGELTVKAPEKSLPYLITKVENNTLKISMDNSFNFRRGNFTIYVPVNNQLKGVVVKGTVSIRAEKELEAETLEMKINGTANVNAALKTGALNLRIAGAGSAILSGSTQELAVEINGTGSVNGNNLKAMNATLDIAGAGSINAYVSGELDAIVRGVGSIKVNGNPKVRSQVIKGLGSIKIN
ncbi:head GIN domain-containing protein [Capnocytophaga sp. oral taxon 878]|uniref:head GIN domain-containing protein n=1 Tax=Capnocytophaga sp. oral taxon 878 TaxID=1316596 RepID=UPI0013EAB07B|nr:head GIN domain-containing protein [Capnocytophaga sp. oral taxon 878]